MLSKSYRCSPTSENVSSRSVAKAILMLIGLISPLGALALPFIITPTNGTALPTQLTSGQSTTALYTITNNDTTRVRSGNSIYYLPPNVSQVLSNTNYPDLCTKTFSLQPKNTPGDSCTLELLISGTVNDKDPDPKHHLFACYPGGKTCAGTASGLNVQEVPALDVVAAAGYYSDNSQQFLNAVQTTFDNGITWIQQNVPTMSGTFQRLNGISCSSGACIGVGSYHDDQQNLTIPTVVTSTNNGSSWSEQVLPVPDGYDNGELLGIYCNGTTCEAVGEYAHPFTAIQPVVATTINSGITWSQEILDLPTNYIFGQIKSITCTSSHCIGAGLYVSDTDNVEGGIITRANGGNSWTTQILSITTTHADTELNGISCTSVACLAVGTYLDQFDNDVSTFFIGTSDGASWSTQTDISFAGYPDSVLTGVSCTNNYCVAVGIASIDSRSDVNGAPAVAVFDTSGHLVSNTTLPIVNGYQDCPLYGIHCTGNTCIASGGCNKNIYRENIPFVAVGTLTNSTWTWTEQLLQMPTGVTLGALKAVG